MLFYVGRTARWFDTNLIVNVLGMCSESLSYSDISYLAKYFDENISHLECLLILKSLIEKTESEIKCMKTDGLYLEKRK